MYKIETERGDLFDVNMMIAIKKMRAIQEIIES